MSKQSDSDQEIKYGSDQRKYIISAIIKVIKNIKIDHSAFFTNGSLDIITNLEEEITQQNKKLKNFKENDHCKILGTMFGQKNPFSDSIANLIQLKLRDSEELTLEKLPKKLTDFSEFKKTNLVAENIFSQTMTWPNHYIVYTALNNTFSNIFIEDNEPYKISDSVSIRTGKDILESGLQFSNPNKYRNMRMASSGLTRGPENLDKEAAYLEIKVSGYISDISETETLNNISDVVRSFYGLAMVSLTLDLPTLYSLRGLGHFLGEPRFISKRYFVFGDDNKHLEFLLEEPESIKYIPEKLMLRSDIKSKKDLMKRLAFIKKPFNENYENDEGLKFPNILKAASWLYDSYTHNNELLSFIQKTTCLEILLGDHSEQKKIGVTALLANRCAYLISYSAKARKDTISDFKKIYDVRSKIVHNGLNRISTEDKKHLNKLSELCFLVIYEEIRLLKK